MSDYTPAQVIENAILSHEYGGDGSWVANCKECGAELWGDTND